MNTDSSKKKYALTGKLFPNIVLAGFVIVFLILFAACNYPTENSSQEDPAQELAVQATLNALSEEKDEQAAAPTPIPATDTATPPTDTPAPEIIPASQESISADEFQFHIVRIAYDKAIAGMVPNTMGANEKIIFIEFKLISGQNEAFANLGTVIVLESGSKEEAVAWISQNSVHTLASMTYTGTASTFSPEKSSVSLAYVIPKNPGALLLEFPSGVFIDLAPLMP